MTRTQHFPSQNTGRGFFGTIASHADPDEAWPVAMAAIGTATGGPAEAVRNFLDDAVEVWMAQPVGRPAILGPAHCVVTDKLGHDPFPEKAQRGARTKHGPARRQSTGRLDAGLSRLSRPHG